MEMDEKKKALINSMINEIFDRETKGLSNQDKLVVTLLIGVISSNLILRDISTENKAIAFNILDQYYHTVMGLEKK